MRNFNCRQNELPNVNPAIFPRAVLERKALGQGIMWIRRLTLQMQPGDRSVDFPGESWGKEEKEEARKLLLCFTSSYAGSVCQ